MTDLPKPQLNPKQQTAVQHQGGPLLVVAGPGTGKTRVITERIRHLIAEGGVSPQNILALTFTEKAAEEMLIRVDAVMPLGYEEPWLSTFHSFCDRILKLSGLEMGLDPGFAIMTPAEQWLFVREHLFDFELGYFRPLGNPTKFIAGLLALFSRLQDEAVSVEEFRKLAEEKRSPAPDSGQESNGEAAKLWEIARAYETYNRLKLAASKMDFGDLITWTLRLFRERPGVLAQYRHQFRYILVDEFQDTNYAQYQLIKLLAPAEANPNLLVVGDDFQAIYKFRGASLSNILNFKRDYPKAETVILNEDYRNPQPLIDSVARLAKANEPNTLEAAIGIDKHLQASGQEAVSGGEGKPAAVTTLAFGTGAEEAEGVVAKITELISEFGYGWRDFAILARANFHLDSFVAALRRSGIPYQLLGNRGLFDQAEIRYLISFARAVVDPGDGVSLFDLLQSDFAGLPSALVVDLLNLSRRERRPLWEVLEGSIKENDSLAKLVGLIAEARGKLTKETPTSLLYRLAVDSGLVTRLLATESVENQLKIKNLNLFFGRVKTYEAEADNPRLPDFVNYLDLLMEAGENPAQAEIEDIDTVHLLTVHSAKGLEFPVVFLVDLVAGRFPSPRRSDALEIPDELVKDILSEGDAHLQEERRLFYVGCTRASRQLFLSWAEDYGGRKKWKPSGFIDELGLGPSATVPPAGGGGAREQLQFLFPGPTTLPQRPILRPQYRPDYLSYSQLETFDQCPLKYKYRYILGVPTLPSHTLNFGQTIHRTLRDFHRANLFAARNLPYLWQLYETHWINEGYESEAHKKRRFEEGKRILEAYYNQHAKRLGKPLFLEKKFTLRLGDVSLAGSIDRVDEIGSGVEVIDYKTGKARDQKTVDKDEQLTIYALAARDALGLPPASLALYFVESNEKVTTRHSDEELDQGKEKLLSTIEAIKKSDFEPTLNGLCRFCEYRQICPVYKIGG